MNHVDEDGVDCLRFTDQGGLTLKLSEPKVVHCYRNKDQNCCLYRLLNKYVSLMPDTNKARCLYLRSKRRPTPKQWYIDSPLGINAIRQIINELCEEAGLPKANYRNQSGRATSCTRMLEKNKDGQLICSLSGHRSIAVRSYKHIPDSLRRNASEGIQGELLRLANKRTKHGSINGDDASQVQVKNVPSDVEDFEPQRKQIVTPLKRKINVGTDDSEVSEICKVITNIVTKKKYEKICLNIKFIDE